MGNKGDGKKQSTNLRNRAEEVVRGIATPIPESLERLSVEDMRQAFHDLEIQHVELEMQNEELCQTEVDLDISRARYFDLYDRAPVGYCTLSEHGQILEANLTAAGLLGMARELLTRQSITRFIHKDDQDIYHLQYRQLHLSDPPKACELRMVRLNETVFWAHLDATVVQDANGDPVYRVVLSDISERKDMELKLRGSEAQVSSMAEHSPVILYRYSNRRGGLYYSPRTLDLLGYTPEELLAEPMLWHDAIHPDDCPMVEAAIAAALRGSTGIDLVYRIRHKTGAERWIQDNATSRLELDGEQLVDGVVIDITERKLIEQSLNESQNLLKHVIENTTDVIFVKDVQGRYLLVNPAAEKILGKRAADIVGQTDHLLFPTSAALGILEHDRIAMESETESTHETALTDAVGHPRVFLSTTGPLLGPDGDVIGIFGVARDITGRKLMEESLRESEERYRTLFQQMTDGFALKEVICDGEGKPWDLRFIAVNPAFETLTGLKISEVAGRTHRGLFPNTEPPWIDLYGQVALTGESVQFEEVFGALQRTCIVRAFQTVPGRIGVIFSDITERKEAETALTDSIALLSQFITQAPVYAYINEVTLGQSRILLASDNHEQLIGLTSLEMVGKTTAELFPAEIAEKMICEDWAVASSGKSLEFDQEINGRIFSTLKFPIVQGAKTLVAGFSVDITERGRAERLLAASHEQLRTLLARLQRAQEDERIRISREIHDELGQLLTGLKMDVRWLERKLSEPGLPPALNPLLDRVVGTNELADAMLATVQRIAAELRPSTLDALGLEATLALEARRFQDRSGVRCTVTPSDGFPVLPPDIASDLFYICREALTNVGRHAHATHVEIGWHIEGDTAVFVVCDDGVGMDDAEMAIHHSLGLTGMRERAIQCGGSITFERNPPCGTRVTVRVPCPPPVGERGAPQ